MTPVDESNAVGESNIDNRILNQFIDFKYKLDNGKLKHDLLTGYIYEHPEQFYTFTIRLPTHVSVSDAILRTNTLLIERGFTNVMCSFDSVYQLDIDVKILILKISIYYI